MKTALVVIAAIVGWVFSPDGVNVMGGLHRGENPQTNGCYSVEWNPPKAATNEIVICTGFVRRGEMFEGVFEKRELLPDDE